MPLPLPSFQAKWAQQPAKADGKQPGGGSEDAKAPQLVPTPSAKPSAFQQLLNFQSQRGDGADADDSDDGEGPDEGASVSSISVPRGADVPRVPPAPAPSADGSGGAAAASDPTLAAWNAAAAANAAPPQGQTLDSPVVQLSPQDAAAARAAAVIEARQGQGKQGAPPRLSAGGVPPDEKLPLLDTADPLREAFGPRAAVTPVPLSAHQRIAGIPHASEGSHERRHRGRAFEKSLSGSLNMVEL